MTDKTPTPERGTDPKSCALDALARVEALARGDRAAVDLLAPCGAVAMLYQVNALTMVLADVLADDETGAVAAAIATARAGLVEGTTTEEGQR